MAWIRTSLSVLVIAGATTRLAVVDDAWWAVALGLAGGVAGLASVALWWSRARRAASQPAWSGSLAAPAAVLAAVLAVGCLGLAALTLSVHALA